MPLLVLGFFGSILLAILKLTLLVDGLTWGLVLLPFGLSVAVLALVTVLFAAFALFLYGRR